MYLINIYNTYIYVYVFLNFSLVEKNKIFKICYIPISVQPLDYSERKLSEKS